MTVGQIIDDVIKFLEADQVGWDGAYPDDGGSGDTAWRASALDPLNWALDSASRKLYLYGSDIGTNESSGVGTYSFLSDFDKRMLAIDRVSVGGNLLKDIEGLPGLYTIREMDVRYATWRTVPDQTPVAAAVDGNNLVFNAFPISSLPAVIVSGRFLADEVDDESDVPDIPEHLHQELALLTAFKYAMPTVSMEEAWARLKNYREHAEMEFKAEFERSYLEIHGVLPDKIKRDGDGTP